MRAGCISITDAPLAPAGPADEALDPNPPAGSGPVPSPGPSTNVLEEDGTAASLVAPLSEPSEGPLPNLASKWGFNPGSEDTMDLDLAAHGRMMMGDNTFGRLFGDADDAHDSEEEYGGAAELGAASDDGDRVGALDDSEGHADDGRLAAQLGPEDQPDGAGLAGDVLHPTPPLAPTHGKTEGVCPPRHPPSAGIEDGPGTPVMNGGGKEHGG